MSSQSVARYQTFKDCLAQSLLARLGGSDENSDLDEFSLYLSSESWPILPSSLQNATYESRSSVPDPDALPLTSLPNSFIDTLMAYGITSDVDESILFLRRVLVHYIDEACAAPPVWSSTRTTECEICEREVPVTYHHLIPRSTHAKVLKRRWHPESMLNSVAWLCRQCHSVVHRVTTNEDLAQNFYTVELLLQREDIQRWRKYASKQRFGIRWSSRRPDVDDKSES
ncbi:hypothetical protein M378DRAFT_160599 [Amanita muscaria Koide BX008]|uniref:HNH domain-containing protein n=1 Tax=Amanita muscaria (strain Koide BX008) TaxID=946122 RepID=A0A0C2TI23_AMAMK|nr:hypothetical protein M378DRAFT_160599 [Amanita muscaria Koide BX008]